MARASAGDSAHGERNNGLDLRTNRNRQPGSRAQHRRVNRSPRWACAAALLLSALLHAGPAWACDDAGTPLSIVVPYPAGGSMDATTRIVADGVGARSGRSIVIRNVGGASGIVGVRQLLALPADGCTVLAGNLNTVVLAPLLNPHAGYGPADLLPLGKVGMSPLVVIAGPDFPPDRLDQLPAHARNSGVPLSAGHPGTETLQYLALPGIERRLKLRLLKVPYRGSATLLNDLRGGHLDIAVVASPVAAPLAARGQVKILATLSNAGPSAGRIEGWAGWFVAAGTPQASLQMLRGTLEAALADPQVRARLQAVGVQVPTADEQRGFADQIAAETPHYRALLRESAQAARPLSSAAGPLQAGRPSAAAQP
jgi:tripartite-type tricarboxylate transporter receptor subunit TctC